MNWDNAYEWADKANEDKDIQEIEPRWSWDCGLKLDYDGGLLRVSSRFYQVRENIFDGSVYFLIGDDEIFNREFSGRHIDVLKADVENYVNNTTNEIMKLCENNLAVFISKKKGETD